MANNNIPEGPIVAGASFLIVSVQNSVPYVLARQMLSPLYAWFDLPLFFSATVPGLILPVFSVNGTREQAVISDASGGGIGILGSLPPQSVQNVSPPGTVSLTQSIFAEGNNFLLAGIPYTLKNLTGAVPIIGFAGIIHPIPAPANNLLLLPVTWYANCKLDGTFNSISTPAASLLNWSCLQTPGLSICNNIDILTQGWTNLPDCINGQTYSYCLSGQTCGINNCNGPCAQSNTSCTFQSPNFTCNFDPNNTPNTPIYQNPYFIAAVIGGVVLLIILIIVAIVVGSRLADSQNAVAAVPVL